jgi:hypothetical protein
MDRNLLDRQPSFLFLHGLQLRNSRRFSTHSNQGLNIAGSAQVYKRKGDRIQQEGAPTNYGYALILNTCQTAPTEALLYRFAEFDVQFAVIPVI